MSVPEEIRKIFETLNDWRCLPAYQLERRVDPFFAMYLPHVLETCCGVKIKEPLVPEFPIKKEDNFLSNKADYLAIAEDGKRVFLIELKTDMNSLSDVQTEVYERAKAMKLSQLINDIISIRGATKQPEKYDKLLNPLAKLDLVRVKENERRIADRYKNAIEQPGPNIEILYVQPKNCSSANNVITFRQFADVIEDRGEVATLFSGYLRRWADIGAGDQCRESDRSPESAS